MSEEIPEFRGARKITSLGCYPLKYHKNEAQLRKDLIDRGKKFVSLGGVHYKSHHGMAYHKKKKSVIKVNINGRIMVDPAIHRRINPNYPVSLVRPKDHDVLSDDEDSDEEGEGCGCEESDDDAGDAGLEEVEGDNEGGGKVKYVTKVIKDNKGQVRTVRIPKDFVDTEPPKEKLDQVSSKGEGDKQKSTKDGEEDVEGDDKDSTPPVFTDEEYLIASPVVLGFAFAEKLWLEFTVSGIKEITWNEHAYDSLVLQPNTKEIVKVSGHLFFLGLCLSSHSRQLPSPLFPFAAIEHSADVQLQKALVESHKYHPAESIDDVIQGKGKGLVAVLHGPPGTGKTLTAEGISELLKCPLYMVSAGDLGTDSRYLEAELQKILDICHAWGAILLLDEADVFLEKRNMQDIHRNALVSIFLRQLEYFQGILFLTTNRVQVRLIYQYSMTPPHSFYISRLRGKLTREFTLDVRRRVPVADPHRAAVRRPRRQGQEGHLQDLHRARARGDGRGPDAVQRGRLHEPGAPQPQRPPDQEHHRHRPGPGCQQGRAAQHAAHPRGPRRPAELRSGPQGWYRVRGCYAQLLLSL